MTDLLVTFHQLIRFETSYGTPLMLGFGPIAKLPLRSHAPAVGH
jgi:hypothetical protein